MEIFVKCINTTLGTNGLTRFLVLAAARSFFSFLLAVKIFLLTSLQIFPTSVPGKQMSWNLCPIFAPPPPIPPGVSTLYLLRTELRASIFRIFLTREAPTMFLCLKNIFLCAVFSWNSREYFKLRTILKFPLSRWKQKRCELEFTLEYESLCLCGGPPQRV